MKRFLFSVIDLESKSFSFLFLFMYFLPLNYMYFPSTLNTRFVEKTQNGFSFLRAVMQANGNARKQKNCICALLLECISKLYI